MQAAFPRTVPNTTRKEFGMIYKAVILLYLAAVVLPLADLCVRATHRDGDVVAIREVAHYWMPISVSDCAVRPSFYLIFHTDGRRLLGGGIPGRTACSEENPWDIQDIA